ncbi:MAG TPA: hypothetical protein VF062_26240 [Candidatus Limnocylindrales bacterium]
MRVLPRLASYASTMLVTATAFVAIDTPGAAAATATHMDPNTHRQSPGLVATGPETYNYAPTVMKDGKFRMWWCGGINGDNILYAESDSINGPFRAPNGADYQSVFKPTGSSTGFDGLHTCDPSVIRVRSTYYMYYGGLGRFENSRTSIGVAQSPDGIHWTRLNGGRPIVTPRNATIDTYGAGQPTVGYVNGKFHMMYTDMSGLNGARQYAIRSSDPTFQSGVETATASGWVPLTSANKATYLVSRSFSADMQYSDALDAWIVLSNQTTGKTYVRFLAADFSHMIRDDLEIAATWVEGPGLVSKPDKHSLPPFASNCGRIALDYINASGRRVRPNRPPQGDPDYLRHFGQDLITDTTCADLPAGKVGAIYDGYMMQSSGLPATFVTGNKRLQSASFSPLLELTKNSVNVTSEVFHLVPHGAGLHVGQTAIGATGKPGAFLFEDDTIWPVNALEILTANNSSITMVSVDSYNSHPRGPSLYRVR